MKKRNLIVAGLATLAFWLITMRTGYPYVADDYYYVYRSYLPDFSLRDFSYLVSERPLSTSASFLAFKFQIFEKTKILFLVFFFLHSLGVLSILDFCIELLGTKALKTSSDSAAIGVIGWVICLYPCWFEVNLMALDLPWGLGVPFLALALHSRAGWRRWFFTVCALACLETYVLPALAFFLLEALVEPAANGKIRHFVQNISI